MISPASFADLFILHSFLFLVNLFLAFFCFLFLSSSRVPYQYTLSLPLCKEKISQYFVIFFFYQFTSPFLHTFPAVPALRSHLFWIVIYGWLILDKKKDTKGIQRNKKRTGSLLLSHRSTIFAVMMLNFCVRYGYRCVHHAIATRSSLSNLFRVSLKTG